MISNKIVLQRLRGIFITTSRTVSSSFGIKKNKKEKKKIPLASDQKKGLMSIPRKFPIGRDLIDFLLESRIPQSRKLTNFPSRLINKNADIDFSENCSTI